MLRELNAQLGKLDTVQTTTIQAPSGSPGLVIHNVISGTAPGDAVNKGQIDLKLDITQVGASNGVASLDSAGKVPLAQLPASLMEYQGVWDASQNSPALADGTGVSGYFYRVNVAGTQTFGGISEAFVVGDWIMYDGSVWQLAHSGADAVISVNGYAGVVVLAASDIGYDNSVSGLSSTQVKAAIDELAATKLSLSGGTMSGALDMGGQALTDLAAPSASTDAATKGYVDTAISTAGANYLELSGGTMSGDIDMGQHAVNNLSSLSINSPNASGFFHVGSTSGGLDVGVSDDGTVEFDNNSALAINFKQAGVVSFGLDNDGSTDIHGHQVHNVVDPTSPQDAATKNYVDAGDATNASAISAETMRAEAAEALLLPLAGGTMTGPINMGAQSLTNVETIVSADSNGSAAANPVIVTTGQGVGGQNAGVLALYTGTTDGSGGNSGDISLNTGLAPNGTRGNVNINGNHIGLYAPTFPVGNFDFGAPSAQWDNIYGVNLIASGTITAPNAPVNGTDAANKTYVDAGDATNAAAIAAEVTRAEGAEALLLPLAGGQMSGAIDMNGEAINNLLDPVSGQDAATKAYVDAQQAGGSADVDAKIAAEAAAREAADALLLPLAGGTMSGAINMGSQAINSLLDPVNPQDAATKNYVDAGDATNATAISNEASARAAADLLLLPLAGGTMSGAINMGSQAINSLLDPVAAQDAATKNYVDAQDAATLAAAEANASATYLPLSGGTMTGALNMGGNQSIIGLAAFFDGSDPGNTGKFAFDVNARHLIAADGSTIAIDFGTAGTIDFHSSSLINLVDPVNAQDAATKHYVDTAIAAIPSVDLTPYFKKDGSVIATGNFDMGGFAINDLLDPVLAQDAATKNYVDVKAAAAPIWMKYTFAYSDLAAASPTNAITLFSLAAKQVIHGVVIKHETAFAGGSVSAMTLAVGVAGDLERYSSAFDVFQAVGASTAQASQDLSPENFSAATVIQLSAVATGDNLSNLTAGSVDIWVAVATLP